MYGNKGRVLHDNSTPFIMVTLGLTAYQAFNNGACSKPDNHANTAHIIMCLLPVGAKQTMQAQYVCKRKQSMAND